MWDDIQRLHVYHGDVPVQVQVLKLAEEVGEAAEALIGVEGLNARKGICHTWQDVLDELTDVIITAAVAMCAIAGGEADQARGHFERRLDIVTARAGLRPGPG